MKLGIIPGKTSQLSMQEYIRPSLLLGPANPFMTPFSQDFQIEQINKEVFKNSVFRENQREVILASLAGNDIFVCMPTGGGKSLTFQLPAVKNKHLTIVFMPLISLIQDQVEHLQKLNIPCRVLSAFKSNKSSNDLYREIYSDTSIKILFITPEKVSKSEKANELLKSLYDENRIERFAIDEAHCVSQWGREFRNDYLKLGELRKKYPNVPIIALTGTATDRIRQDVMNLLKMRNPKVFQASFNRPNLFYEVRVKTRKVIDEIAEFINAKHRGKSGLIYCISKKDCEKVSKSLKKQKIKAGFYHAGISEEKRTKIQIKWMEGQTHVLVATVAFGMGIDKRAVRYVLHYSFPKSLENYYQESGRAGRDGLASDCIIYFSYADKCKQDYLIAKNKRQDANFHELYTVMNYCEDFSTCRRKLQLSYFGENFDPVRCNSMCDNCKTKHTNILKNCTENAIKIVKVVQSSPSGINTLAQIASFLKGLNNKKTENVKQNYGFSLLSDLKTEEIEGVIRKMVYENVLVEKSVKCSKKFKMTKLELGPKSEALLNHKLEIFTSSLSFNTTRIPEVSEKYPEKSITKPLMLPGSALTSINALHYKPLTKTSYNLNRSESPKQIFNKVHYDPRSSLVFTDFVPRIPYEENIEIILDPTPPKPQTKNLENLDSDLREELKCRLEIVRKKISRQTGKAEHEVLSNDLIDKLISTMWGNIHPDFFKEIEHFKMVNSLNNRENTSPEMQEFGSLRFAELMAESSKKAKLQN